MWHCLHVVRESGRVGYPFPGVEFKLGDLDVVLLKGGQVFKGYWRNPQATEEAFTDDGFFRTGGFNVYPREVELVLETHPAVEEVAVAGVPSEAWGEEVTAFVVPKKSGNLVEADVIAYARERLATYKCPRRIVVVETLPRNAMGKIERSKLRAS